MATLLKISEDKIINVENVFGVELGRHHKTHVLTLWIWTTDHIDVIMSVEDEDAQRAWDWFDAQSSTTDL